MRRVVKLGGSLLSRPDLLTSLPQWMERQTEAETLVIVGGGKLIDAVRELDRIRCVDPAETHWLCVELLDVTCRLVSQWFAWPRIETPQDLAKADADGFSLRSPTLVDVRTFYHRAHPRTSASSVLPMDWRTTTDAIAALLARQTGADELVLLKSCDVDAAATIEQLATSGVVDQAMPLVASYVSSIRVEKLR